MKKNKKVGTWVVIRFKVVRVDEVEKPVQILVIQQADCKQFIDNSDEWPEKKQQNNHNVLI